MDGMDFDFSGNDSECERNEGFWSESDGELSDNVVTGGEVQAAGNEIRPYQFEPEAGQEEENGDEIPVFESFFFACTATHVRPRMYGHARAKERPVWLLCHAKLPCFPIVLGRSIAFFSIYFFHLVIFIYLSFHSWMLSDGSVIFFQCISFDEHRHAKFQISTSPGRYRTLISVSQ